MMFAGKKPCFILSLVLMFQPVDRAIVVYPQSTGCLTTGEQASTASLKVDAKVSVPLKCTFFMGETRPDRHALFEVSAFPSHVGVCRTLETGGRNTDVVVHWLDEPTLGRNPTPQAWFFASAVWNSAVRCLLHRATLR